MNASRLLSPARLNALCSPGRSLQAICAPRQQRRMATNVGAETASAAAAGAPAQQQADAGAKRLVLVVAVALIDGARRVLLARRPEGKAMAGLWEFPGGKVDPGETPEAALVRELREELGIEVDAADLAPLTFASHSYDSFHLLMPLYACRRWRGAPAPAEGQRLAWARAGELRGYEMPAADVPLVAPLVAELAR